MNKWGDALQAERDEALRLHVEDHARIDALLIERGEARAERDKALAEIERGKRHCDEAVKTWRDLYREAIGIPPSEHQARRMEQMAATSERVAAERDEALAALARVRAVAIEYDGWAVPGVPGLPGSRDTAFAVRLRAALEGP